jgi:hypothetical protein
MPTLSKADFKKPSSAGKYAGNTRHQIILEKIKAQDQFTIGKTAVGKKIYGVSLDAETWPYKLSYSDRPGSDAEGKLISILKLWKDPDFGGGAGSGGGAKETSLTESGQCYYTSLVFNVIKRKLKQTDCTPENLHTASKFVDATISIEDFIKDGPQPWIDSDTYRRTANLIYNKYKTKFKTPVYCHRGSKFMDNIYKAKKAVMKSDKFSAPGSFSNDKWNPGDIWLSSLPPKSQPLKESKTWAELNQSVLDLAGELKQQPITSLLGVSLKKLADVGGTVDTYNSAERKHNVDVKFKGFKFGKTGDFFSSMDIYLQFDVAEVQLRAFNTTSAWQGEIKGLAAAGGKIGGGNLNYYLGKHTKRSIGYAGSNRANGVWKEMPAKKVEFNKMYAIYSAMNELQTGAGKKFPVVPFDEFVARTNKKGSGFIFSKNMCLMFIQNFLAVKQEIRNKISTEIVRYAASNTEISSYYIKVY